ncbi:putative bifunctional diguanylate cyclase/phosphodiesterase [Proteocatella sphenisci]|uniref:putative bifunctional diguanylate cyclase/phosphodiesterase n=1 Tax=Proteocatella sphenisci TaxID=181070 RepID=UPI00146EE1D0|nr:GGDEF domain-containing phosphodiesterase [Proteocatella sphenisci]
METRIDKDSRSDLIAKLTRENDILKRDTERYRLLLEGSQESVWEWDLERGIYNFYTDRTDFQHMNATESEMAVDLWSKHIHPGDHDDFVDDLQLFIKSSKKHYEKTFRVKNDSGEYRWIKARGAARHDESGQVVLFAGSVLDITDSVDMERNLIRLAYYDKLTGLPNKEKIKDDFGKIIAEKECDEYIAFVHINIDNLSYINNTFGYSAGDEMIRRFSGFLSGYFVQGHCLSRVNADEFLIIYRDFGNIEDLERDMDTFFTAVRNEKLLMHSEIKTSISAGISVHGVHGETFFDLLKCSDVALYYCKNNGKDQFRIYDSNTGKKLYTTIDLINQIRIGLEKNEFQMHYQPIVSSKTGKLVGIEALARWYHSKRGVISPGEFIVAAENSGQIKTLERWIIEDVFKQIEAWRHLEEMDIFVSINLSAKGLIENDLITYLEAILEKYIVNPEKIEFEVTETALMNNIDQSMTMLNKLKKMGFKLALDDFGTGYSSLNYLKNIPIDKVKLDRSFVENIDRNTKDQLLVKSIIELSHRMELEVVGEGVETHFQNTLLGTFGCDYIQGYFHGRPQDKNQINTWIKQNYI